MMSFCHLMMNEMLIGILFLSKMELHLSPDNPYINGPKTDYKLNAVDHEVMKVDMIGESLE